MSNRTRTLHVLPFSHLDLFWLGNRHECFSRAAMAFQKAMELCRLSPDFRFLIEDAVFLENYFRVFPERARELAELMGSGRIEGPAKYAAITNTTVAGETIARNLCLGLRLTEELTGRRPRCLHLGDLPGHPSQLPQLAAACGLEGMVLSRGGPSETPFFRWRAPDGSAVRSWYAPECYAWGKSLCLPPEQFRAEHADGLEEDARRIASTTPAPVLMHCGWDLMVLHEHLLENAGWWNEYREMPMKFATQEEFFEAAREADKVPEFEGEIPTVWGNWPDAAYLDVTIHHAEAERNLLLAERLESLLRLLGRPVEPDDPERPWKELLQSMDHNYSFIAPEEVHRSKIRLAQSAALEGRERAHDCMERIASSVRRPSSAIPLVVFNPSCHPRNGLVKQRVILYGEVFHSTPERWEQFHLVDEAGEEVPHQIIRSRPAMTTYHRIAFVAREVPPLGYRTYYVKSGRGSLQTSRSDDRPENSCTMQTSELRATVSRQTGRIVLETTGEKRLLSLALQGVEQRRDNNIMQLRSTGRAFPFDCRKMEVESGPVLQQVRLSGLVSDTPVSLSMVAPRALGRVELRVRVQHPGRGFLRLQLHGTLPGGRLEEGYTGGPFAADPFGGVVPGCGPHLKDEVRPTTWPRLREAQDWFMAKGRDDAERAVAVGTERKLIELLPEGFAVNILSSNTATWIPAEDYFHPAAGTYETRFTVGPAKPGDLAAGARCGEQLFMPLEAFCDYGPAPEDGPAPSAEGFIEVDGGSIQLAALKRADCGEGTVARLVETSGQACRAAVKLRGAGVPAFECNLLEEVEGEVDPAALEFGPFEIKTLLFKPEGGEERR